MSDAAPPVLDMARVIAYAILDQSVKWTGRQKLLVDGKEMGPAPRLALCQNLSGDLHDILLFHCDEEWNVLACSGGKTIEDAKASAERAYKGISEKWVDTNVTEDEAKAWIVENCRDMSCSFCDRLPSDFKQLIESKSGVRICNYCIDEHYASIHSPEGNDNVA
jgi:hypothetical protein